MGRPSKLTESQLEEIKRRITTGEGVRALAAEFGVSPALVSKLCSPKAKRIKAVANQVFEADKALARLPVSERPLALRIVDDMKHTAANLARGARAASETFADLAEMAREQKGKVRQADGSIDFKVALGAEAASGLTSAPSASAVPGAARSSSVTRSRARSGNPTGLTQNRPKARAPGRPAAIPSASRRRTCTSSSGGRSSGVRRPSRRRHEREGVNSHGK